MVPVGVTLFALSLVVVHALQPSVSTAVASPQAGASKRCSDGGGPEGAAGTGRRRPLGPARAKCTCARCAWTRGDRLVNSHSLVAGCAARPEARPERRSTKSMAGGSEGWCRVAQRGSAPWEAGALDRNGVARVPSPCRVAARPAASKQCRSLGAVLIQPCNRPCHSSRQAAHQTSRCSKPKALLHLGCAQCNPPMPQTSCCAAVCSRAAAAGAAARAPPPAAGEGVGATACGCSSRWQPPFRHGCRRLLVCRSSASDRWQAPTSQGGLRPDCSTFLHPPAQRGRSSSGSGQCRAAGPAFSAVGSASSSSSSSLDLQIGGLVTPTGWHPLNTPAIWKASKGPGGTAAAGHAGCGARAWLAPCLHARHGDAPAAAGWHTARCASPCRRAPRSRQSSGRPHLTR